MINGFSVFSSNYKWSINDFLNDSVPLPNKPYLPFDDDYVRDVKTYEAQIQEYFISFCSCLWRHLSLDDSNFNGRIKDAYYKIRNNYKDYRCYIKKAKHDYNESKQIVKCLSRTQRDGSMSPSNPFYSIDDEGDNVCSVVVEQLEGFYFLDEVSDETCVSKFLKKLKKLVRIIKKRNKKKLTKNQRKKLKKKIKMSQIELHEHTYEIYDEYESASDNCISNDPQIMIQDFFRQYSLTGEWSWSKWNNYISKIQQINPVWFDLFNRYSYEMGINWNAMFTSDVNAQNANNVRLEAPEPMYSYQPCYYTEHIFHPNEGKSVIFTPDVKTPSDDTNNNELFCAACKYEFKSQKMFHIHLRGVKHIQNELNYVRNQKPEQFITEVEKQNSAVLSDITKEEKHIKWLLYNENNSNVPGKYTCTTCNVTCTSQKDLHTHLGGEKHHLNAGPELVNTSPILSIDSAKIIPPVKPPIKKIISRIQIILNTCTQPLIGLNYVTEFQKRDELLECKYVCDLCKVKFERKTFIQHMVSQMHRETYLKCVHRDLYNILRQDLSSKSVKMKRLEVFSSEVESFEGRKKLNIMLEKMGCDNDQIENMADVSYVCTNGCDINMEGEELKEMEICHGINDVCSETDDKEDGEVESSDDESFAKRTKTDVIAEAQIERKESCSKDECDELEAGEIENNLSDKETANDNEKEAGELEEDDIDNEKPPEIDLSEFNNYEIVFGSDRSPLAASNRTNKSKSIEFIRQLKDGKKVKLKEVTADIIEYFKQEAMWALNNTPTNGRQYTQFHGMDINKANDKMDIPGALLLPSMSVPVGPIYTGNTSTHHYTSKKHTLTKTCPEIEWRNIVNKIESMTGLELIRDKNAVSFTDLLQRVQMMLVNKDCVDNRLNDAVREELLLTEEEEEEEEVVEGEEVVVEGEGEEATTTATRAKIGGGPLRRYLLPDPVDLESGRRDIIDRTEMVKEQLTNHGEDVCIKRTEVSNNSDTIARFGDRMKQRAHFLGLDQPPPPHIFPKMSQSLDTSPTMTHDYRHHPPHHVYHNNTLPMIYSYISPGMIEHHNSYALCTPYQHNNIYNTFLRPDVTQSSLLSDTNSKTLSGSNN